MQRAEACGGGWGRGGGEGGERGALIDGSAAAPPGWAGGEALLGGSERVAGCRPMPPEERGARQNQRLRAAPWRCGLCVAGSEPVLPVRALLEPQRGVERNPAERWG